MGVVYHAIDPNIGRPVAIKTIQLGGPRSADDRERLRERLFREARSAGMLSHPGIVTIYDVEQQGDLAYIAMEFVDGPTLDQLLSGPEPLAPDRMFAILAQTAAALDFAHSKGIVHRDIKPANIMIAADGAAKITDFGIAKITASEQFTMTGSILGTPHYMSPEQIQGQPVDGRSDQFSLGVIAFEMLTGEKPYTGEHLTTVVYKIVAEEPIAPHRINSTLAGPIENALRKGLAKKPDARYRTCGEFIDSLEKACAATKIWRAMPRGGVLRPPQWRKPRCQRLHCRRRAGPRATSLPPQRMAAVSANPDSYRFWRLFLAAALLALIGWQSGTIQLGTHPSTGSHNNGNTSPLNPPVSPATGISAATGAAQSEIKPSPMPSAESAPKVPSRSQNRLGKPPLPTPSFPRFNRGPSRRPTAGST